MYDCFTEEETANEIEMFVHVEEVEAPTNGLDEIVDWDKLEEGFDASKFASQQDFYAEVAKQFEESNEKLTRGWYRAVIKGLFPDYREMYLALPPRVYGKKEAA